MTEAMLLHRLGKPSLRREKRLEWSSPTTDHSGGEVLGQPLTSLSLILRVMAIALDLG